MRVPLIDRTSTTVAAAPSYRPQLRAPDTSIEEGLGALGTASANLAGATQKTVELEEQRSQKARLEAEAVAKAGANSEYHRQAQRLLMGDSSAEGRIDDAFDGTDTSKGGFLRVKGLEASAQSGDVLKRLGESRKQIAATLSSPRARQEFLQDSAETALAYSKQVEGHVGKEFDTARVATAKALDDTAVGLAASGIPDFDAYLVARRQAEEAYRTTALSKEAGAAAVSDFRSRSALAFTTGLIAQGRAQDAASFVKENRGELGARFANAANMVERATAGDEKDRLLAEAGKLVNGTAESLAQEGDGYVSEEKLRAAVKLDETGPEVRAEVEAMLERRIRQEEGRLREDIGKQRDNANRADLQGRPIPGATMDFLTKYDPDFLLARQARQRAEARAWKASRSSDRSARASEAAAQKAVDQEFLLRLQTELVNDPATKPDDFLQSFIAEKAKEGDDVMVSDVARAKAGLDSAKAGKKVENGELSAERNAAKRFETTIRASTQKVKGKPVDGAKLNERVGKALQLYRDRTEAKGKPLDEAELAGIEAEVVREAVIETPRVVFGVEFGTTKKKAMGVDLVEAPTQAETAAEEKTVGGKSYVKRNGKWVLK